jgi:hypothetical protein
MQFWTKTKPRGNSFMRRIPRIVVKTAIIYYVKLKTRKTNWLDVSEFWVVLRGKGRFVFWVFNRTDYNPKNFSNCANSCASA